jgi:two-component system LytT family response regulator
VVLRSSEIVRVEAEDYYVLVHSKRGRPLMRMPLTSLEEQLDPSLFVRVHRAAIVNIDEIQEIDQREGTWLALSDGSRLPVSRARKRRVEELVGPRLR